MDINIDEAMLCWDSGLNGGTPAFRVVFWPDYPGYSDAFNYTSGACNSGWHRKTDEGRRLQLLINAWHISAFYAVPIELVHEGLLAIPQYRAMLADDCLPKQFQNERAEEA